ncbi:MAG TPA: tRNA pseudouridine(55) synthase TruB [Candidatus Omnitrophica bacterium]|nr:tRNA pseudouridine(55) synthase TruB [Candidatus Omnitrophota bacterium]
MNSLNGILLVDKPVGITSHDVVDYIRRRYMLKKVGHGGTLDPLASGLLIIMLGKATKLSQRIIGLDKEYIAEMILGFSTTTGDLAGEVIEKAEDDGYLKLSKYQIEKAFQKFLGEIFQIPPMYSAVKYRGVRLYKLARKGIEISREPRKVKVYNLIIEDINLPRIRFRICCSRGLYIRQLCIDIGKELGYPAHLSQMIRTAIGKFNLDSAHKLDKILNEPDSKKYIIPLEIAIKLI